MSKSSSYRTVEIDQQPNNGTRVFRVYTDLELSASELCEGAGLPKLYDERNKDSLWRCSGVTVQPLPVKGLWEVTATYSRLDCAPLVTTLTALDDPMVPPSEVVIATEPVEVERPEQLEVDGDEDWLGMFILAAVVCAILGLLTLVY
jgi:hypothetical protein